MQLFYNAVGLHELGEFAVSTSTEYEGGNDAPQRAKITLKVTLWLFESDYEANAALGRQAREALRTQQGVLRWTNDAAGVDYVNQTATVLSHDLPEEWGQFQQTLQITFQYYAQEVVTQNQPLFFKRAGSNFSLTLANVSKFAEEASTERFSPWRPHRKETRAKVSVSGQILAPDTTVALADRRAWLAQQVLRYREQMNGAEGACQFGTANALVFDQVIRVESCTVELDQLVAALNVSFTASYTLFPNEANYASAEYTAEQKDSQTGEEALAVSGRIQAATEGAARTKLSALLSAARASYGYTENSQQLRSDSTATLVDADTDGHTFTELSFSAEYRKWRASNQGATFCRSGLTKPVVSFGQVRTWNARYTARRFNEQRSQRQHAGGTIEASGTWIVPGDPDSLTVAARRALLLDQHAKMLAECNHADGTLTYGSTPLVVRIDELRAEINQAERGIDWSFTASYSLFPNEAGYATCEFSVAQRDSAEEGEEFLTFAGKIGAENGAAARAKLASLRTAIVTGLYGWTGAQQLRAESTVAGIAANGDRTSGVAEGLEAASESGVSFIELSFSEEYRRRKTIGLSWSLQINTRDDVTAGLAQVTYSGSVSAGGANVGAAYAAALAKAVLLGRNQEANLADSTGGKFPNGILKASQINWDQRRTRDPDNAVEFVRLTFSYDYTATLNAGRAYLEISSATARDSFGPDVETVSGAVVAASARLAQGYYETRVLALYPAETCLRRAENVTTHRVEAQSGNAFKTQQVRLEFSFQILRAKAGGALGLRYSLSVSRDYLQCEQQTHVRGSLFAANETVAALALESFLEETAGLLGWGQPLRDDRTQDREWVNGGPRGDGPPEGGSDFNEVRGLLVKYDFDVSYVAKLTSVTGLLEFRLSEEVQYSGTRWVAQPLPYSGTSSAKFDPHRPASDLGGRSVVQPCGVEPGSRTVRGSVTAATRAACEVWVKTQRARLTGAYPHPEKWDWDFELVPRTQGLVPLETGDPSDVKLHRLTFNLGEILPDYPPPE